MSKKTPLVQNLEIPSCSEPLSRSASLWTAGWFAAFLGLGTFAIGITINSVVPLAIGGANSLLIKTLAVSLAGLSVSVCGIVFLTYRLELDSGSLKRQIRAFEVGWKEG